MKFLLLLASLSLLPSLAMADSRCTPYPDMKSILGKMKTVPPEAGNARTIETQQDLIDCGSAQVIALLSQKSLGAETSEILILLTAKIMLYDNSETADIFQSNAMKLFRQHFFRVTAQIKEVENNVFHQALARLEASKAISREEKQLLVQDYQLDKKTISASLDN